MLSKAQVLSYPGSFLTGRQQRGKSAAHHNTETYSPPKALHALQAEAQGRAASGTAQGNGPAGNHISKQVNVPAQAPAPALLGYCSFQGSK